MDFYVLTRRELQSLCKRNKIPANMTNVAMAEALDALEMVTGLEEIGPGGSDLMSPYVPTAGKSTGRRIAVENEPTTQKATRSTRKISQKDLGNEEIQTPAVSQARRRKDQIDSACGNIDSQMESCIDEEEIIQATPANLDVNGRRGRVKKVDTAVKSVYNTRRSARLAKKTGKLDLDMNENTHLPKIDVAAMEYIRIVDVKENINEADETSVITELDVSKTGEQCVAEGEPEVDSVEQHDLSTATATETKGMTIENVEADDTKPVEEPCDAEGQEEVASVQEQELSIENREMSVQNVEADDAKSVEEKCDAEGEEEVVSLQEQELSIENKSMIQENDEAENTEPAVKIANEAKGEHPKCEDIGITEESFTNSNYDNGYEMEYQACVQLHVKNGDISENTGLVEMDQQMNGVATDSLILLSDFDGVVNEDGSIQKRKTSSFPLEILDNILTPPTDETKQSSLETNDEIEGLEAVAETPALPSKQVNTAMKGGETSSLASIEMNLEAKNQSASEYGRQQNLNTPKREPTTKKKFTLVASDNKENICSGSGTEIKLALTKERKKIAKSAGANWASLSLTQLRREVKEALKAHNRI